MKKLLTLAAVAALSACGGGGGGDAGAPVAPPTAVVNASNTAQGIWDGTLTGGFNASVAILENGETWGIYSSGNTLVGAVYGQTTSTNTTFAGNGLGFDFAQRRSESGTYTGNVSPKSTISFVTNDGTRFSGSYDTAYDQPASLANLAGSYSGFAVTGTTQNPLLRVSISANGAINASVTSGNLSCAATGTATPRASGKNIFDIRLNFTGGFCDPSVGATASGIAFYDVASRQIGVMALNPAKTDGLIYIGTR